MDPKTGDWRIFYSDGRPRQRLKGLRGPADREAAEKVLREQLIADQINSTVPRVASELPVMSAVHHYAAERAEEVAKPQLLADAIEALSPFWSDKTVAEINRTSCNAYVKWRTGGGLREHHLETRGESGSKAEISRSTARRDLTTLRAALKFCQGDGRLIGGVPVVVLPDETPARDRVMTRDECAAVLRELWRGPPTKAKDGSRHRSPGKTRHAARLFWLMLYTGSRAATVYKTTRRQRRDGPWIDSENNLWQRRGSSERETNKLRKSHKLPGKIRLALERWERLYPDQTYIVERPSRPGEPIGDIGQALDGACARLKIERITPHTIKHTAISLFIAGGGDPTHASEFYSTSLQTILDDYLHLSPDFQEGAMEHVAKIGKRPGKRPGKKPGTKRNETPENGSKQVKTAESK